MALVALLFAASTTLIASTPAMAQAAPAAAAQKAAPQDQQIQAVIDAIKNDKTRQKLIDALEKANAAAAPASGKEAQQGQGVASVGRRIAEFTQSIAQGAAHSAEAFVGQLALAPTRLSALEPGQMHVLLVAMRDVALSIVATYLIYFGLRWLAVRLFRRIGDYAENAGFFRRAFLVIVSAAIDAAVVALAWAAGYLVTLFFFGPFGVVGIRQSLYLNAFLLVELSKVLLRVVLSPATGDLRLVNIDDPAARLLNNRFSWIIEILGYGQLFVTPIFNQSVSIAAGQAMSVVLSLIALAIAVSMTVRNRFAVRNWLIGETTDRREPSRTAQFIAEYWYLAVLLYFAFLFIVILTQPAAELLPVLGATAEILAALMVGFGITGWLARANGRAIRLPENVKMKLPLLEARLNALVPRILTAIRIAVFLSILLFALNIVGAIDIPAWVNTRVGAQATAAGLAVVVILLVAAAIWLAMTSWVDYRLNPDYGSVPTTRETTLLTLMRNAATIALVIVTLMFVLSEMGINIAPLIASAGVLGLAIGFGAQKLVQDIITGVFIQLENAINVGDVVTAGGTTGVAERLTIRSVSLRDLDGTYHIIPFSSVDKVANFMKGFSYYVCNMGVAYRESYDDVKQAMHDAFDLLRKDPENSGPILGDLEWFGVTEFGDSAVVVRARIKTLPGSQWGVGRAYNRYIKQVFDERNIEIPFPHQTIYFGEDKRGRAPVAHVRVGTDQSTPAETPEPAEPRPQGKLSNVPPENVEGEDAAEVDR